MNNVNKTLYIPLYGKAYVSRKGIILQDKKAEEIWEKEGFELKGKSKSKWLAYYMGMRSAVFDTWVREQTENTEESIVLHIGCGLDSRCDRAKAKVYLWYDVDFPDVIGERKKYYSESETYQMISADARKTDWISTLPSKNAIVVLEGISMYFTHKEMQTLLKALCGHFESVRVLMDCYTQKAAKASKYRNPINDVGVTLVYGTDDPQVFADNSGLEFVVEHSMTPENLIKQLKGAEHFVFKTLYGGAVARAMYRMYEYKSK